MLPKRFSRLVHLLSKNARQSTKSLGKQLRVSQQSASYIIQSAIKRKQILNFHALIDPARFGLTNVIVLYNYTNFNSEKISEMKKSLKENIYVTIIEESSQGADLIVQFTVPNLSLFNKENQDFIYKFKKDIKLISIYPIIVKHLYTRKYLSPKSEPTEWILSGDRNVMQFNERQKSVMKELKKDPKIPIITLAKNMNSDAKTVLRIKNYLEAKKILRQYSIVLNYKLLDITRERILLHLDTDNKKEVDRFISFCKYHKNILSAIKIIGDYNIILTIEKLNHEDIISELRKEFKIENYQLLKIKNILKSETVPDNVLE